MEATKVRHISSASPDKRSDNKIRNTKYTVVTFLPCVVFQQFHSFSSVYFFAIMLAQLSPQLAISSFASSFLPWLFVLGLSLVNEGVDDYKRHQRDKESNSGLYKVWKNGAYVAKESAQIKTGDIILIEKGGRVPADCILLKADDPAGEVFIRTDQLDGETDWKRRLTHAETQSCQAESLEALEATAELPHKGIYSFAGTLDLTYNPAERSDNVTIFARDPSAPSSTSSLARGGPTESVNDLSVASDAEPVRSSPKSASLAIDLDNTIWANTVVATASVLGLVVYTGNDTRSMMNTYKPRSKTGRIEKELDHFIFILGLSSFVVAILFTAIKATGLTKGTVIIFMRFLMLFSYVIPISLKVTLSMARIFYVGMIQSAKHLDGVIVRSSSLQEELGRISFFLTDKTGTLTKNEMVMKKVHLGTICYTSETIDEIRDAVRKVTKKEPQGSGAVFKKNKGIDARVYEFIEALALCHGVTPVESDGEILYQASSPDEIAIVKYCKLVGVELHRRDTVRIVLSTPHGQVSYKILQMFPFNSDTKRMGIIVQKEAAHDGEAADGPKGKAEVNDIMFLEKGADSAMKPIVKDNDWVEEETDTMARDGLRTLLIGKKILGPGDYESFRKKYEKAKLNLSERTEKMLAEQIKIENRLELLGLTGVEDKLQDRVRPTLENLRNAGMKVWMLTGDKIETAISIAMSSRLLNKLDRYIIIANCQTREEVSEYLKMLEAGRHNALVIDGISLAIVIDHLLHEFIMAARELSCVVGCRYSPTQKATMAAALRSIAGETVCCIGDGGNDVSMITEADVGVGIEGKEGNQASLAADFSIKKFADIADLLFWHGRRCYKNTSAVAGIIIHRGTIVSAVQGIFCALIYFIPISIFQGKMLMLFILYTFGPLYAFIHSEDVSRCTVLKFPELYKELRNSNLLSVKNLLAHNLNSLFQGSVIMLFLFFELRELFSLSILVFTCLIINEQALICLTIEHINRRVLFFCAISLLLYAVSFFFFEELKTVKFMKEYLPYVVGANLSAASLKFFLRVYRRLFKPASYAKLGESGIR